MPNNQRPTIIIFSHAYLPFLGGAETAVKGITDELGDFNFVMLTGKYRLGLSREEKIGNVLVYRMGLGFSFDKFFLPIFAFFKFLSLRRKLSGPILFWAMMVSYSSIAAFFLKYFYPQIPLLLTIQEGDSEEHIRRARFGLVGFFWRLLVGGADKIQVISNYLADLARSFGAKVLIEVVPNGVDLEKFSNPDIKKTLILSQKLGIKPNEKIIITVSRLVEKNAVDIIIRAMSFVKTDARLLILGTGEEKSKLLNLVRALNLESKVIFEENTYEDLPAYLKLGQIFVRPSRSEGLGTAFLEAMAAGLPIIATSVGGIKDFLKDGETGLAIKVDDPEDLARKIDLLFTDETLRQKLIQNGRKLVEEKYQWFQVANKMKEIFTSLL
ncbi:MAG: glycosyltransferase family 4 protein [bacterium]|nr:glycosyltransferase family 4 protein [bacterium]